LEDGESLTVVRYIDTGDNFLHGLYTIDAELNHIKNFMLIGAADDNVVWPLFVMRAKHKEGGVSLLAKGLKLISTLKGLNIVFT